MKKLLYILLIFALFSCDEDDLTQSDPIDLIGIDQSTDLGKSLYDIYVSYGSVVKFDYDSTDYRSGIKQTYDITFVTQKDPEVISTAVDFTNEFLFHLFDEEFMVKYAPRNIFLADTIKQESFFTQYFDTHVGYSHIAISGFNSDVENLSFEEKETKKLQIKLALIKDYLIKQNYMFIPEDFGMVSEGHYNNWQIRDGFMDYGFWQEGWSVPWNVEQDFGIYLDKIATMSHEEILLAIDDYPLMEEKYLIVLSWLVDNNIDL